MNRRGFNAEVTENVIAFYNNIVLFIHFFSPKVVCFSLLSVPFMAEWDPIEILSDAERPLRDGIGRFVSCTIYKDQINKFKFDAAVFAAHLIDISDTRNKEEYEDGWSRRTPCYPVRQHEEADQGSSLDSYHIIVKVLIAENIYSIRRSHCDL